MYPRDGLGWVETINSHGTKSTKFGKSDKNKKIGGATSGLKIHGKYTGPIWAHVQVNLYLYFEIASCSPY